ncbi:chloramphenicol phosphotransferase CPT family protein [Martelella soudanensis]|uniref:chloramphenicol phosphotransferase CPT family protein n=1 Tax=unclassified Martelella TaxID=2629616 RepID=UPI0015DF8993|nr:MULTISPECIES: AAA family ATPase [unclassified Martelella]
MSQIIFLHGASSSGKSTLARHIQATIEKPFWHISIDHLRDSGVLPTERFKNGDFEWRESRSSFFAGFHASLAAYAHTGNNLIVEHILDTDGWYEALQRQLAPFDVYFVAVRCPLRVLIERERARGNRIIGSAKQDFETIHVGKTYDLEIQSQDGIEYNTELVLKGWRSGRRISDFSQPA